MPVLDSTEKIAPKSILRYRPIDGNSDHPKSKSFATDATLPPVARASRVLHNVEVSDDGAVSSQGSQPRLDRQGNVTRVIAHGPLLYLSQMGAGLYGLTRTKPKSQLTSRKQSRSFIFYLLLGMIVALILWIGCSQFIGWAGTWSNDLRYGRPRTFQTDVRVGHNNDLTGTPSHFIAVNLNQNIEVLEFPGGDATQARTFAGPQFYGQNDALVPVTLTFVDLNHDKKLDMVINFQNQHMVYINTGKSFRLPLPSEQAEIERALQP